MLDVTQYIFLGVGILVVLASLYFFFKDKEKIAISSLIVGALIIRLVWITIDPFLHVWDECFHALVAKNMMYDPFTPMLYPEKILYADSLNWSNTHIWLHKQPLFMWQMALSMHLFGINEYAIRIPSAILGSLQCYMIFRIGKLAMNSRVGYFAAFLWVTAYFHLKLITGIKGMAHNDVVFCFYITASIWAFIEYWTSNNKKWLVLIGVFSGCAVLTKWLVGILVYSGWGLALLVDRERRRKIRCYLDAFKAFGITCLVFLPWQFYIFYRFPREANYENAYNNKHLFEAVEGHAGNIWFHMDRLSLYFGSAAWLLILLGGLFTIVYTKNKSILTALLTYIIIVYVFFSIVATKVDAFCNVVSPLMYIGFGAFVFAVEDILKLRAKGMAIKVITVLLIVMSVFNLRFRELELEQYADWKFIHNKKMIQKSISSWIIY